MFWLRFYCIYRLIWEVTSILKFVSSIFCCSSVLVTVVLKIHPQIICYTSLPWVDVNSPAPESGLDLVTWLALMESIKQKWQCGISETRSWKALWLSNWIALSLWDHSLWEKPAAMFWAVREFHVIRNWGLLLTVTSRLQMTATLANI